jgi:hypothetical protein
VQKFQKFIVTEARTNGLSPERLGEAVHVVLSTAKPKARYAVIPQGFKNWILPRLLPVRMVDAQGGPPDYDVSPDGKRIAALLPAEAPEEPASQSRVVFLMNFFDELRRRVQVGK